MTAADRLRAALAGDDASAIHPLDVRRVLTERDMYAAGLDVVTRNFADLERRTRAVERVLHSYDNARGHVDPADLAEDLRAALRGEA